jgi:Zn-dependent protease with chaperone function
MPILTSADQEVERARVVQRQWRGHYLDGRRAVRREAAGHLTATGLAITLDDGTSLWWRLDEIRQSQGRHAGEPVRLERGGEIAETLVVSDLGILAALREVAPAGSRGLRDPGRRRWRMAALPLGVLAVLAAGAGLYLWGIPAATRLVSEHVPVSWEEGLGRMVTGHIAPPERRCQDPTLQSAVDAIMARLVASRPGQPYTFRVFVLADHGVNALAAPGGYIVLLHGLIETTGSPDELAGVLAHEAQHVMLRHATRALATEASTTLLLTAALGDVTGLPRGSIETARVLGSLRYSRLAEDEADREGRRMLAAAGVDRAGMIGVFEKLQRLTPPAGRGLSDYLSTHPSLDDRIGRLRHWAAQHPGPVTPLLPGVDWDRIRRSCGPG